MFHLWCRALACIQSAQLWLIYVCSVQYYAVASLLCTLNLFVMYTPPVYITVRTVQAGWNIISSPATFALAYFFSTVFPYLHKLMFIEIRLIWWYSIFILFMHVDYTDWINVDYIKGKMSKDIRIISERCILPRPISCSRFSITVWGFRVLFKISKIWQGKA